METNDPLMRIHKMEEYSIRFQRNMRAPSACTEGQGANERKIDYTRLEYGDPIKEPSKQIGRANVEGEAKVQNRILTRGKVSMNVMQDLNDRVLTHSLNSRQINSKSAKFNYPRHTKREVGCMCLESFIDNMPYSDKIYTNQNGTQVSNT